MADAQQTFTVDPYGLVQQEIVVLGYGAVKAVLDGQYCPIHCGRDNALEDLSRDATGYDLCGISKHLDGGHVTVGSELSLNRNLHRGDCDAVLFFDTGNLTLLPGNLSQGGKNSLNP
jgi:hypothetical protein